MSRHIEFRNYTDDAVARIPDQIADLILGVIQPVRSKSMELGKFLTLNAKALVIRQMPVKYIELHRCHSVQIALEHIEGNKVAAYIDHQSPPRKTWFVLDGDPRHGKAGCGVS